MTTTATVLRAMAAREDSWRDSPNRSARRQRELIARDESESYSDYVARIARKLRPDDTEVQENEVFPSE